ncbi:MAG: DUF6745 domain-containing protein, partial [Terriglobales bacterium]
LYRHFHDFDTPAIIWCDSPWQAALMKSVLENDAMRADLLKMFQPNGRQLMPDTRELVNRAFDRLDEQLDDSLRRRLTRKGRTPSCLQERERPGSEQPWNFLTWLWASQPGLPGSAKQAPLTALSATFMPFQAKLTAELHGVTEALLESDPNYAPLTQIYVEQYVRHVSDSLDNVMLGSLNLMTASAINNVDTDDMTVTDMVRTSLFAAAPGVPQSHNDSKEFMRRMDLIVSLMRNTSEIYYPAASANWLPFFEFMFENFPDIPVGPSNKKRFCAAVHLARQVHSLLPCAEVCFVVERPQVLHQDDLGRPHSENTVAIRYDDGYHLYCWHGTRVPRDIIE